MSKHFARPLDTLDLAYSFLTDALGFPKNAHTGDVAIRISSAELLIFSKRLTPTLTSATNRHPTNKSDRDRQYLRKAIFEDLISKDRLESDDDIEMGIGGARPMHILPRQEKKAFIITGLPASGKSTIANKIADLNGAYILDSDYAKRKFPEFKYEFGADLVHEESSLVVWGMETEEFKDEPCLFQYCVLKGNNMVIPKIGHDVKSLEELKMTLIDYGYEVHLTLVSLGRVESTRRALGRFSSTNRYVPLSLIFDGYSNDPILSYYRTKHSGWTSTGKLSTNVAVGSNPLIVETDAVNPASLFA